MKAPETEVVKAPKPEEKEATPIVEAKTEKVAPVEEKKPVDVAPATKKVSEKTQQIVTSFINTSGTSAADKKGECCTGCKPPQKTTSIWRTPPKPEVAVEVAPVATPSSSRTLVQKLREGDSVAMVKVAAGAVIVLAASAFMLFRRR